MFNKFHEMWNEKVLMSQGNLGSNRVHLSDLKQVV